MIKKSCWIILSVFSFIYSYERPFVIVIPSYNNSKYFERNLNSVFAQQYSNYRVIYTDDCSPDGTGQLVAEYINKINQNERVTLICNTQRKMALANIYYAVHSCAGNEIIVLLDGDDWFKDETVLSTLNEAYSDPHVWMTYGQFEWYPSGKIGFCEQLPGWVIDQGAYRAYNRWVTSHLLTFYAKLFKRIKYEDFLLDGNFFPVAWDLTLMFPMLEMSRWHTRCLSKVLCVYNFETPINDEKIHFELQKRCDQIMRAKERYKPLTEEEFNAL